jgi:S1-C subfamily serine protease
MQSDSSKSLIPQEPSINTQNHENSVAAPHRSSRGRMVLSTLSLVALGAGMVVAGEYIGTGKPFNFQRNGSIPPTLTQQANPPQTSNSTVATLASTNFITHVVDKVGPAVVRIDATKTVKHSVPDAFNDPFFRRFFGDQFQSPPSKEIQRGVGSGFVLNANGEILTNAHVVNGADTVTVTLKNGRTYQGKVMGADPLTDVAVVKVQAKNLPTVALGDSSQLKPGEWAIAIGNPLGLDNTVTVGIISATGRSSGQVGAPQARVNFIQTDAAINPGNSGGPLLNSRGEAIGVNTAIIQDAQGIGFAIPIRTVQKIAQQLIEKGKVEHPYLGIQMVTLTPQLKEQINSDPNSGFNVDDTGGVLIGKVESNSPADRAGLRAGDVIRRIDRKAVKTADAVQQVVEAAQIGQSLQIELNRNRQLMAVTVKAGKLVAQANPEG